MNNIYWIVIIVVLGLCIGSFLNVIIYRLPRILMYAWQRECETHVQHYANMNQYTLSSFSLALPRSHCPYCQHTLRWYHNLPLLSFLWLKGRCAFCQHVIDWHYPAVEMMALFVSLFLYVHFGLTFQFAASLLFSWILITLIVIDFQHQILPDDLTLGLLWLGLIASVFSLFVSPIDAIIGAVSGYGFLWLIASFYHLITKREGMGHGDFKLLAALGAWAGWQQLPWIMLIASVLGVLIGLLLMLQQRAHTRTPIAFGPYLALAGWVVLLWGEPLSKIFW